jgi:hypothetical protein
MSRPTQLLLFLLSAIHASAIADLDAPQSIASISDYGNQRLCAQACFWNNVDNLGGALNCPGVPAQNSCYCRADLQPVATTWLFSCVNSACKNSVDIASATSIYEAYCTPKIKPGDAIAITTSGELIQWPIERLVNSWKQGYSKFPTQTASTTIDKSSILAQTVTITSGPSATGPTIQTTTKVLVGSSGGDSSHGIIMGSYFFGLFASVLSMAF